MLMIIDNSSSEPGQIFRIDALVGCGNLLAFSESLLDEFGESVKSPFSLLSLDVNAFSQVNDAQGHLAGDAVLRWIGLALMEETGASVYRIGGDEFVALFNTGSHADHVSRAQQAFDRLNNEANRFGLNEPAASIALIQYWPGDKASPAEVFIHLGAAMYLVKADYGRSLKIFLASEIEPLSAPGMVTWLAELVVNRMASFGEMLDESQRLAYTDPVTGLPNIRAAQRQLDLAIGRAQASQQPFSILLVDGDDLKQYNNISYAAGDEMIQRLGAILNTNLRPGDFLARWRMGDEFLVILPIIDPAQAVVVAERLCAAVRQASQTWPLPVTISVGVAAYPDHGASAAVLLLRAEATNQQAKAAGKDNVVV